MGDEPGLLSIGVPVRNGGALLARALASVAAQTYEQIEVIISDNASSDGTEEVCRAFVAEHPRARYVRQDEPLSATDNYRFVRSAAHGEYFASAAHDDDRSSDFGARLVGALNDHPGAGLAYPTLLIERPGHDELDAAPFRASTTGLSFRRRVRWPWWESCLSIYGVHRRAVLDRYAWHLGNGASDVPLLSYVAVASEIIHVPGPTFTYRLVPKRDEELPGASTFRVARINWDAARAGVAADAQVRGRRRSVLPVFASLEGSHMARRALQLARRGRRWEPLVGASAASQRDRRS